MSKNEEVLGVGGLAKWLDVDRDTVRTWVDQHRIPFFRIGDHIYFLRETLLQYFAQLERENPANGAHTVVFTDAYAARPTSPELYKPTIRFEGDENPGETSKSLRTHTIGSVNER
jgi:excisionase family DNA binding protein